MATTSSPQSLDSGRTPSGGYTQYDGNGDLKENYGVNKSATSPAPSGRVTGSPMSPVRVNVQPGNWQPSASSAKIENIEKHGRQFSEESDVFMDEKQDLSQMQMPVIQDLPYRPSYTTSTANNTTSAPQSQKAIPSSVGTAGSGSPSSRSSPRQENGRHAAENRSGTMTPPVPRFQYHHQSHSSDGDSRMRKASNPMSNSPSRDQIDAGTSIGRHLTPTLQGQRRPVSAYSEMGPRGRSTSPYM